jgi:hypothetical protein
MHLLIDISHHGFGHIGQTAPVIERLLGQIAGLTLTVRTTLPRRYLASRLLFQFNHAAKATDVCVLMNSLLEVDRGATEDAYAALHADWPAAIETCARETEALAPDLVLSNASYLALAGAARAGIPCMGYGSLNWADIYRFYRIQHRSAPAILDQIVAAYASASNFLAIVPHMPMTWLPGIRPIGPVAKVGTNRRDEVMRRLGLDSHTRLVLVAFGGMPLPVDCSAWPPFAGSHFLVPGNWRAFGTGFTPIDRLDMPFEDLLRSCNAVISKPGYGIVVEAACNGTPLIYVPRHDWPEQEFLIDWLGRHGIARAITLDDLLQGRLAEALDDATAASRPTPVLPTGIEEATQFLNTCLTGKLG